MYHARPSLSSDRSELPNRLGKFLLNGAFPLDIEESMRSGLAAKVTTYSLLNQVTEKAISNDLLAKFEPPPGLAHLLVKVESQSGSALQKNFRWY